MSTKLSSRVPKGVGAREGATGSCAASTVPMDASGAVGSVVVAGRVGSGCCGTSSGCEGKNEVIQRLSAVVGRFINLRKRGKPGKKASITVRDGCRPVYGDIR